VIYDAREGREGEERAYQVVIGDESVSGEVNLTGTGRCEYRRNEMREMNVPEDQIANPRKKRKDPGANFVADDLGDVALEEGTYDLILAPKGKVPRRELFRPRAVILNPLK
jgi:hypothetical protein